MPRIYLIIVIKICDNPLCIIFQSLPILNFKCFMKNIQSMINFYISVNFGGPNIKCVYVKKRRCFKK